MKKQFNAMKAFLKPITLFILISCFSFQVNAQVPFEVYPDLFDQNEEDSLGLTTADGTETITVFAPTDSTDYFSNGVFMTAFNGNLYCQWQSSAEDEDAPDTWVAYSRSEDGGLTWTAPMELAPSIADGYSSSGGWWVNGDTLVAYINTWPEDVNPRGGFTRYTTSEDGINWSPIEVVEMENGDTLNGIFEQDPYALSDGRIVSAAHFQPGLIVAPIYTDDPSGTKGWNRANFSNLSISNNVSREIEPSWFLQGQDTLVMIFRDQNGSYKKLASVSTDQGENWTTAVLTDMPDSRSKQSAGNLPDGTAYFSSNPKDYKTRIPLAVTLSADGYWFNTAYVLRKGGDDLQELRYEGLYKRLGYHYPKSMVWEGHLYVSYATNKEDVEFTRVPVANLEIDNTISGTVSPELSQGIEILYDVNGFVRIDLEEFHGGGTVNIYNINGQILGREKMSTQQLKIDLQKYNTRSFIIFVETPKGRKAEIITGGF